MLSYTIAGYWPWLRTIADMCTKVYVRAHKVGHVI